MPITPKHLAVLTLAALACAGPSFAEEVATVLSVEGVSVVQRMGAQPRILGAADTLAGEDVVSIGPSSHAIIEFTDRTQITLRPGTVFRMAALSSNRPDSLLKGLIKGGMRSAAFDARWCEGDCTKEERRKAVTKAKPVARVVEMKGTVAAERGGGNARLLVPGAAVYERDSVATGVNSHAVLVFSDGSRISLAANSRLSVSFFQFDYARHTGSAVIIHHAGEAMVATGKIAKQGPTFYRLITPLGEVKPLGTLVQSIAGGMQQAADQSADAVRETGEAVVGAVQDTAGQAAQTALNAAITPILQTMSALMTGLRDNPPATEAGWNELTSQMTQMSNRLHGVLDEAIRVGGAPVNSDAFKTVVGLALAAEFEIYAVGAAASGGNGVEVVGFTPFATLKAMVADAKASPYQSESLALVGLSRTDLDRVSNSSRYGAHTIIETEVGGYLASQGNAAANDFFSKAEAAADELRLRAQQAEAAATRAAAEAEQRAIDDAQRAADEARAAEREAARLAAEAEELRQRQREKLQEGQAKLKEVADAAKGTGKAVVEAGQDAVVQAAQAALNAAVAPIMSEMTRLMTDLRNNPPATEEAWNQMKSRLAELSSRLHGVLENTARVTGAALNSREYKSIEGLVMAADLEIYSVLSMQSGPLEAGGVAAFATLREMVTVAKADPDQSERLALVGLSSADLDRVLSADRYMAHAIIEQGVGDYLASQGNAAANDFFAQAQAAALAMQERARQTEEAAARVAEEAAKRAAEKARAAKREAERLAEEAHAQSEKVKRAIEDIRSAEREFARQVADLKNALNGMANLSETEKQRVRDTLDEWSRLVGEEVARKITEVTQNPNAQIAITTLRIMGVIVATVAVVLLVGAPMAGLAILTAVAHTAMTNPSVFDSVPASVIAQAKRGPDQAAEAMHSILTAMVEHGKLGAGDAQQINAVNAQLRDLLQELNDLKTMDKQHDQRDAQNAWGGVYQAWSGDTSQTGTGSPAQLVVWDGSVEVSGRIVRKNELLRRAVSGELIVGPSSTMVTNTPRPDLVKVAPGLFADVEIVSGSMTETITKKFDRYGHGDRNDRDERNSRNGEEPPDGYEEKFGEPSGGEHANRDERNSRSGEEPPDGYKERFGEPADGEHTNRDERNSRSEKEPPDGYKERYAYGATDRAPDLYVWVRDGVITLSQGDGQVEVAAGDTIVVTKDQIIPLDYVPNFLRFDRTPWPGESGGRFELPVFVMPDGSIAGNCVAK